MKLYELEIWPQWWTYEGYTQEVEARLKRIAMNKSCSPYVVVDEFSRLYTAFCSYRYAIDAAVEARLAWDCTTRVYPIKVPQADIGPLYALIPLG